MTGVNNFIRRNEDLKYRNKNIHLKANMPVLILNFSNNFQEELINHL
jgi:hypothetical protein